MAAISEVVKVHAALKFEPENQTADMAENEVGIGCDKQLRA